MSVERLTTNTSMSVGIIRNRGTEETLPEIESSLYVSVVMKKTEEPVDKATD